MKILVTGGAGFIGSNFITHMLTQDPDIEIVNLDSLTYAGNLANCAAWQDDPRYTFVKGDICDRTLVDQIVAGVDAIVHFAAESHVDRSVLDPEAFIRTNVNGTFTLLDAALKAGKKRFHHVSTDEVFGQLTLEEPAFTEESPYKPRSPYSASKAASDHLVRAYHQTFGLPITISNCSNNYGPFHHPEKLIPLAITNLLEGKKVPVYGAGDQIRDWLYVEDHARAIALILHNGRIGETYCVGGENQPTNLSIVEEIISQLGKNHEESIEFVQDRPGHDFRYDINCSKITAELGWKPQKTLDEGLRETLQWYKDNETWWKDVKSGAYEQYYENNYSHKKKGL